VKLAYFIGERDSRQILIQDENAPINGPAVVPASERRLEAFIVDQLGFPNEAEFDQMHRKLDNLRDKGLRPAEGIPDCVRDGVKLRVTVEVL
jgi:hypothetical protein